MAGKDVVGKARFVTEVDPSGVDKGLDQTTRKIKDTGSQAEKAFAQQGTGAASKFGTSLKGIDDRLQGLTNRGGLSGAILGGVGLGAGLSVFNTVQNMVSGAMEKIGQSIDLASDKAEAASKAQVLFGDSYGIVEDASKSAATAVGLSSGAYLSAAGDVANLIQNFGIAGDEAAGMSRDIVQLSADMGSFNNASTVDVTEAIGAAFRGETEPIRRFGVMLDAASVAAKAVELGLAKSTKAVDKEAKARATYQLILDQTTKAQGDFARTSDGYANAQRIAAARQEEAMTRLGEAIKPLALQLLPLLADAGTEAITVLSSIAASVAPLVSAALDLLKSSIEGVSDAIHNLQRFVDEDLRTQEDMEAAIRRVAEARGYDADAAVAQYRAEVEATRARDAANQAARAQEDSFRSAAATAGVLEGDIDALRTTMDGVAKSSGQDITDVLGTMEGYLYAVAAGSMTLDEAMALLNKNLVAGTGASRAMEGAVYSLGTPISDTAARLSAANAFLDRFATHNGPSVVDQVQAVARSFAELGGSTATFGSPAFWAQQKLMGDNLMLLRSHLDLLPSSFRKVFEEYASGLEGATSGTAEWAGTIAQVYQGQLVNHMQAFWTGDGRTVLEPPPQAVTPSPEVLAAVTAAGRQIAGALHLDFKTPASKGMSGAFRFIENNLGPGLKSAILTAKDDADKAMDEVRWVMNHPKKWAEAVQDTEKNIRQLMRMRDRALANGKPGMARYLEGQLGMFVSSWEELTGVAWDQSLSVGENFRKGLIKKKKPIGDAAQDLVLAAKGPILDGAGNAYKWGSLYAKNMAKGMNDNASLVDTAAGDLSQVTRDHHKTSSPSKKGPWSLDGGPEGWGRRYARLLARGMAAGRAEVAMASSGLAAMGPALTGWSLTSSATQTVDHRVSGTVQVELSPSTIAAARDAGASWEDVGRMAGAANVGDVLAAAQRRAGTTYLVPAGRPL